VTVLNFTKQDDIEITSKKDITKLIKEFEPKLREVFLTTMLFVRDQFTIAELATMFEQGTIESALNDLEQQFNVFSNEALAAYIASGNMTAGKISTALNQLVGFDVINQRAVNNIQNNAFGLIQQFSDEQRRATRAALLDGVTRGINPREQAINFKQSIGLTTKQVDAVNNFRRLLTQNSAEALTRNLRDKRFDASIRNAISTDTPLTSAQIDKMVERYRQKYLIYRSEVIARTESLRAVHEGSYEMFNQAVEAGTLLAEQLTQQWNIANDSKVRNPSHTTMRNQQRPFGEPFLSGNGNLLRYPGDPRAPANDVVQCRCAVSTRYTAILAEAA